MTALEPSSALSEAPRFLDPSSLANDRHAPRRERGRLPIVHGLARRRPLRGRFRDGVHTTDAAGMMRRLVKENLLKFNGKPLFPERRAYSPPVRTSVMLRDGRSVLVKPEIARLLVLDEPDGGGESGGQEGGGGFDTGGGDEKSTPLRRFYGSVGFDPLRLKRDMDEGADAVVQ